MQAGQKFSYGGRISEDEDENFCKIVLNAGGEKVKKSVSEEGVTFTKFVHEGGVTLTLSGSTEADKYQVGSLRNICFFAGNLAYLESSRTTDGISLTLTGGSCKHCGAHMITMAECEWKTCRACASKCEHEYETGMVHGPGVDMDVAEFCGKCGRAQPHRAGEREKKPVERHLAVESRLGIKVLYKNGPPVTPTDAVQLERFARRYKRSKRRVAAG
jgi:hypothetical protein